MRVLAGVMLLGMWGEGSGRAWLGHAAAPEEGEVLRGACTPRALRGLTLLAAGIPSTCALSLREAALRDYTAEKNTLRERGG